MNDLKNTFLGIAAHDLRSPLSTMKLATDMLDEETTWPSQEERLQFFDTYVDTVKRQTQHMIDLLNDLLDITQIESGKLSLRPELIPLKSYLTQIAAMHNQLARPKGTKVELGTVTDGIATADPLRLRQVLDNLISNAVKYSPPGSTVWVGAEHKDDCWQVSVRDQGPGLTEDDRPRLFNNFARLSARPTGGEKSVGLGLAITRRVVEAHGGEINVDSVPGKGATFWFTLPDQSRETLNDQ